MYNDYGTIFRGELVMRSTGRCVLSCMYVSMPTPQVVTPQVVLQFEACWVAVRVCTTGYIQHMHEPLP